MKAGDRVVVTTAFNCSKMFYDKEEIIVEQDVSIGELGTVESAWASGAGIVDVDNRGRVMVMDLASRFSLISEATESTQAKPEAEPGVTGGTHD